MLFFSFFINFIVGLWQAYVISVLWAWFAVPFLNLPPLNTLQVYALLLIYALIAHKGVTHANLAASKEDGRKLAIANGVFFTLFPAISLLFGWVIRHFI